MKCHHCRVEFYSGDSRPTDLGQDVSGNWQADFIKCPSCNNAIISLIKGHYKPTGSYITFAPEQTIIVWPKTSFRPPCPPEVPKEITDDYNEACLVLADSLKASAALSRRCLQNLLRDAAKVKHGDLANEIQQVLDSKSLPSYIAEAIDAIRNIGNFAAHPQKSRVTGDIMPVEPGEAEWNLDVLESLFDFYYVQPAIIQQKRNALNQRLNEAGKPSMKG